MRNYILEATGTFFLVLVVGFTGNAIAIGLVLAALTYAGKHVSGAHYNPAVSLAFLVRRKLSIKDFSFYLVAQLSGSFLAALVIYFFASSVFYVVPPYDTNLYQQTGAEILLTFLFVWTVLVFHLSAQLKRNKLYGFAIGLTFAGLILTGVKISGGIFNPAISAGPALYDMIQGGDSMRYVPLYVLAPMTGAVLAAAAFGFFEKKNGS